MKKVSAFRYCNFNGTTAVEVRDHNGNWSLAVEGHTQIDQEADELREAGIPELPANEVMCEGRGAYFANCD